MPHPGTSESELFQWLANLLFKYQMLSFLIINSKTSSEVATALTSAVKKTKKHNVSKYSHNSEDYADFFQPPHALVKGAYQC